MSITQLSFRVPLTLGSPQVLTLARSGQPLDPADHAWYARALFGACRLPTDLRRYGIAGLTVSKQHAMPHCG